MGEARSGKIARLLALFASLILASCGGNPAPSAQASTAVALTSSEPTPTSDVTHNAPSTTPSTAPTATASAVASGVASSSPLPDGASSDGTGDGGSPDDGTPDPGSADDGSGPGTDQGGPPTGPGREGVDWVSTAVQTCVP